MPKNIKNRIPERDNFYAKLSFYLSLGFWLPLFNIGLGITSIIIAIVALKKHYQEPQNYGGVGFITAALIISITAIIITAVGATIFLFSKSICGTSVCQTYLMNITKP